VTAAGRATQTLTVRSLLRATADRLGTAPEARWVVAHALGVGDRELPAHLDRAVAPATASAVDALTARRLAGEPLQYVLGRWAFRTLDVVVDPRVLVPRPETEQVVDAALAELAWQTDRAGAGAQIVAVDLGTGSGVIALSLAVEGAPEEPGAPGTGRRCPPPSLEVWATDASSGALAVARVNADALAARHATAAGRVRLAHGSWFDALPPALAGRVALVVSNPPYVSSEEWEGLEPVVRCYEPRHALVAGRGGLEALELIVDQAPRWLAPGGGLVLEIAPHQADALSGRATSSGYEGVEVRPDLAGRPRALVARRTAATSDAAPARGNDHPRRGGHGG